MNRKKFLPGDAFGRQLYVGSRVRVCAVPDLSGISDDARRETAAIFRFAVGRAFPIQGFDDVGLAELELRIPVGENRGLHTIWIEPYLLKKLHQHF